VDLTSPIIRVGSNGRCNTIWYKAAFKGGVYEQGKRFGLSAEQMSDVWRRWKSGQTLHEIGRKRTSALVVQRTELATLNLF
jgi:hypothetical protein